MPTLRTKILKLAKSKGVLRPRDLARLGADPAYLRRLTEQGAMLRLARGLYALPEPDLTEHHTLAEISAWVPGAIVSHLTAARFHSLGLENPGPVWITLARGHARPRSSALPRLVINWLTNVAPEAGVQTYLVEGVKVQVTTPARTVVDLFRSRRRVGLTTALEALRDALRSGVPLQEIRTQAERLRCYTSMAPYLEALSLG